MCAAVTARPSVRQQLRGVGLAEKLHNLLREHGVRGLERAGHEIIDLANAGATKAECLEYPTFLHELIEDIYTYGGVAAPDLQLVRRERSAADREDDRLTDLHHIDGEHAVSHTELAAAYRRAAAANIAAACEHERQARMQKRFSGTAKTRLLGSSPS